MSVSENIGSVPVAIDAPERLRVDCYVRSAVPTATAETIETITARLRRLCDEGPLADCRISHWPPERHAVSGTEAQRSSRHELVDEFDCWADRHGYSLEPAFRREEIPPSPLGVGPAEPRERVRVPLVALALYEDEETTPGTETASLRGVVPYTTETPMGEMRTYTVAEWLSAVEAEGVEPAAQSRPDGQPPVLEGHR